MRSHRSRALAFIMVLGWSDRVAYAQEPIQLLPRDQASRDKSFLQFRMHLLDIIRHHDAGALLSVLDPDTRFTLEQGPSEKGRAEFIANWGLTRAGTASKWLVWNELRDALESLMRGEALWL